MHKIIQHVAAVLLLVSTTHITLAQAGGCNTTLESIETASLEELSQDFLRLASYRNPYCDTTNSDYEKVMKRMEVVMKEQKVSKEDIIRLMGTPYYHGPLAEYENQKLTIGRDGKPKGKSLPPSYKIPPGEYYVVYLWRKKDYLVFALKGNQVSETTWWEKGSYR